jgi:hypothetical protein
MSTTVVVNGLNYYIPAVGENNWGQNVTDALVALATAASSNASVFNRVTVTSTPITVVSGRTYLVDTTSARTLNLPTPANNAYLIVKDTTGNARTNNITIHRAGTEKINGATSDYTCNMASGTWTFVSDGTDWFLINRPDITPYVQLNLTNSVVNADVATAAAIAYSKLTLTGSIVNADVASAAAIAVNKLAALSVSQVVQTDASGFLTSSATLPIARGGTNAGTTLNNNRVMQSSASAIVEAAAITASRALISDANGIPTHSTVTSTELGYVSGVTSAIQTQLAAKLSSPLTGNVAAGGFKFTGLGAGSAAGESARYEQLKILQYVTSTSTTNSSTTSTSFGNGGLTGTITPSSTSSKILIIATSGLRPTASALTAYATIARGGTNLMDATLGGAQVFSNSGGNTDFAVCLVWVDSPASVSALTYTWQFRSGTGGTSVESPGAAASQQMVLIELA